MPAALKRSSLLRLLRSRWLLLIAILLVAVFLRFYLLDRLPPGDSWDPAYYGVDALQILHGSTPIFFTANYGREPLFSYLVALAFLWLGPGTLGIHATSAAAGVITVLAVYWMAHELLAEEGGALGRYGALLAAALAAISYWHLNWSRYGVRAILLPLCMAVVVALLWRGLRVRRSGARSRLALIACGAALGASMYSYQAARLLPAVVVAGFAVVALWCRPRFERRLWSGLALVAVSAALVAAPLGAYALAHPFEFNQRVEETFVLNAAPEQDGLARLWNQSSTTLLAFTVKGEEIWPGTELPGRPILNPFLSASFLLGIAIAVARVRRPLYAFMLAGLAIMMVPAMISDSAAVAKRALGTFPIVMVLVSVALLSGADLFARRAARNPGAPAARLRFVLPAVIAAGLLYSAAATYRDYFVVWAQDPELFTHFQVGVSAIGTYVGQLAPDERIYISPEVPDHPSIQLHSSMRQGLAGYNGRACLVMPAHTQQPTTWVIVKADDQNSLKLLAQYFPQGVRDPAGPLKDGQPYFVAYHVPAGLDAQVAPGHARSGSFAGQVGLLGYDQDAPAYAPGQTMHLTLYYRSLAAAPADYTVFVHLLGGNNPASGNTLWAGSDGEPCGRFYRTSVWAPGEIIRDTVDLAIAPGAPPGDYTLAIGMYTWPSGQRVQASDDAGRAADDVITLGTVSIAP